jgi:type IX secretion system PorP/SprF family membrane protein
MIKSKNRHIRKILFLLVGLISCFVEAQQEAQYTQYMYMTQVFNPAFAGNRGIMSLKALVRSQWIDVEGSPKTSVFSFDTPIGENEKMGLGLSIINDQIGPLTETNIAIDYAYSLSFMFSKLTFGLKVGVNAFDINFSRLNIYDPTDPYIGYAVDNKYQPQIGAGIFFNTQNYYLGLSAPNLLEKQYFNLVQSESSFFSSFSEKIHFYFISGYVFDALPSLKIKPASLVKVVKGSPVQWDLSLNFLINNNFSFGVANRLDSAITSMAGIQVSDALMIGFSYDFSTTEIQKYATGSFEVFFRIDLGTNKKILTPRFF